MNVPNLSDVSQLIVEKGLANELRCIVHPLFDTTGAVVPIDLLGTPELQLHLHQLESLTLAESRFRQSQIYAAIKFSGTKNTITLPIVKTSQLIAVLAVPN